LKYDFTTITDREGKDSLAVDVIPFKDAKIRDGFSKIPMWVADMNFATAPCVIEAITDRLAHPLFGYFLLSDAYYNAVINWHKNRFGVKNLTKEAIGYENGVLGGVTSALDAFCSKGDAILLHAPTYVGFTMTLKNNGYTIILSDLIQDENGVWRMDYEDMKKKILENHIHAAVFCSPHNPAGRVWERWEIEKAMEVYKETDCIVVSDEIWADLTLFGNRHIPTQQISEDAKNRTIAIYAPTKTFNLAGLVGSYHIIYNTYLRDRFAKQASLTHYNMHNVLSVHALIGAYSDEGAQWVDELCEVLSGNVTYAYDFIQENFEGITLFKPQGTYMLYLNCAAWCRKNNKELDDLIRGGIAVGVIWQDGRPFNKPDTIRMNLALPYSLLKEALDRLRKYVFNSDVTE